MGSQGTGRTGASLSRHPAVLLSGDRTQGREAVGVGLSLHSLMVLTEFDFPFDPSLIADRPVEPRDQARLLVVPRTTGPLSHRRVMALPALLTFRDLLVVNDTKVLPARLMGCKRPSGGRLELVFVSAQGVGLVTGY